VSTSDSHYTVLARRFRPQAFDQVVGQDHVARALRNAIRHHRVAHAYLFTGARGVGKTSMARILGKALNCPNAQDGVPCNQCEICDGISAGNDVDVLEIDGASNNGVDSIRALRANVGVRSMRTTYKMYIIDEVHMLSTPAFNALLKTLEEPPPNVKFVFCTTEPNKVPETILSRCQRFDFSVIGDESIVGRLREIAKAEGFEVSDEAFELVARRARGSMRDSQSLFDQLLAFSEGSVSADDVHRMLGTAADDQLIRLFEAIAKHRPGDVLNLLDQSLSEGVQSGELMDQAIAYNRDLMVLLAVGADVTLSSVSQNCKDDLQQQASGLGLPTVMAAFQVLSEARNQMFRCTFARTVLEMTFVQISVLENLSAISDLLSGKLPDMPAISGEAQSQQETDGDQKKNVEPTPAVTGGGQLELNSDNSSEIIRLLGKECGLAMKAALRSVSQLVVSDHNRVEFVFGANGQSGRRSLEENRGDLEAVLEQHCGRSIVVTFRTEQETVTSEPTKEPDVPSPEVHQTEESGSVIKSSGQRQFTTKSEQSQSPESADLVNEVDPMADGFVRQVSELFGGKVVKVTAAPDLSRATEDEQSGDESSTE
jgi:DNA polymerase III subunit gamma/tau